MCLTIRLKIVFFVKSPIRTLPDSFFFYTNFLKFGFQANLAEPINKF